MSDEVEGSFKIGHSQPIGCQEIRKPDVRVSTSSYLILLHLQLELQLQPPYRYSGLHRTMSTVRPSSSPMTSTRVLLLVANTSHSVVRSTLRSLLSLDNAKTMLFLYVVLSYALKVERHIRARGLSRTVKDILRNVKQVRGHYYVRECRTC